MNECKNQNKELKIPPPLHSEGWGEAKRAGLRRLPLAATDLSEEDRERFWAKVDKSPHPKGCWEWRSFSNKAGYGRFKILGKNYVANRIVKVISGEILSVDMDCCHSCDNPSCVNPDHIFIGTHLDNMDDMAKKGRHGECRGSYNSFSKLTEADVIAIRQEVSSGVPRREVELKYNICRSSVRQIASRISWKHL